jgi:CheY-like chemotaxis protein
MPSQPIHNDRFPSVLIVDDDGSILDILSEGLEMFGCRVFKAENGIDAWKVFTREPIDLVLTDIRMPGLDGTQLSHRIRNQAPSVKIAVMTGGDAGVAKKLLEDGTANYYFSKPFNLMTVCQSLMAEAQTE